MNLLKLSKQVSSSRLAAKAVVRLQVHGYSENHIQSTLDPRTVVTEEWIGSGFFIQIKNELGYILTNCHVARNANHLEVQSILTSDEPFRVELVGLVEDMEPDVALLKFSHGEMKRFLKLSREKRIPSLQLGDSQKIPRSEEVRAIGYPLGMNQPNISAGEISNFISGSDGTTERLVTTAPINPGNSGGPSITRDGKVIGINTALIEGANNIGFITPAHLIRKTIKNIITNHRTRICQLAATLQKNSLFNSQLLGMKSATGVIVRKVFRKGLASKIGLRHKDVILSVNDYLLDRHGNVMNEKSARKRNLYDVLHEIPIGKQVRFSVFRKSRTITLRSKAINWPGEGFPSQPILRERRFICFAGLVIQEVCSEIALALGSEGYERELDYQEFLDRKSKLILTHIDDDSPASDLGLTLGDFIFRAQGQRIKNLNQLRKVISSSIKKNSPWFSLEFSSGALANFSTVSMTAHSAMIHKFGEKSQPVITNK